MATPLERAPSDADWESIQQSAEFARLRKAVRGFAFPMTVGFLLWYFLYVLLADYAHDFMSTRLVGNINVGLVLGFLQFVTTFVIAIWYSRHAHRNIDPIAESLRNQIEGETR